MRMAFGFLFLSSIGQADIIKCTFTEPFVATTYSMTRSTLTYTPWESLGGKTKIIKNVSFQIKSAGVFELVTKEGKVLQTLTLNHKGSDGMSDVVFPYEVVDWSQTMMATKAYGGCISNHLKSVNPEEK